MNGDAAQTAIAAAKDQYGEWIGGTVTWSLLAGENGLNVTTSGVSLAANEYQSSVTGSNQATVYISRTAMPGTYSIQARQTNASVTVQMTLSRDNERVESVHISGQESSITAPGKGEDNATASFRATVLSNFNSTMQNASVQWGIRDYLGNMIDGVTVEKETIDGVEYGVVTVAYTEAMKQAVPDTRGTRFILTATCDGVSDSRNIQIVRAEPHLNDITLNGYPSFNVNADGENDVTIPVEQLDQYESPISGATVTVTPYGFAPNGTVYATTDPTTNNVGIFVSKNARPGTYKVRAQLGAYSTEDKDLFVSQGTPVARDMTISGGQIIVMIPADGEDQISTAPFTANVIDQFGLPMPNEPVFWSILDEDDAQVPGISIENGVVTVSNDAKNVIVNEFPAYKTMTISATTSGGLSDTKQINVSRSAPVLTRVQIDDSSASGTSNGAPLFQYPGGQDMTIPVTALDSTAQPSRARHGTCPSPYRNKTA